MDDTQERAHCTDNRRNVLALIVFWGKIYLFLWKDIQRRIAMPTAFSRLRINNFAIAVNLLQICLNVVLQLDKLGTVLIAHVLLEH